MEDLNLTRADYQSALRVGEKLRERGWQMVFSLPQAVDGWSAMIESIREGYDWNLDEYRNDLSCREWLEQALPLLTEPVRANWQGHVDPLDEEFRAVTVLEDDPSRWPHSGSDRWWLKRRPRLLVGELADDLIHSGHLEAPC
ncbi:hypothetical protein [Micromonospora parathelypteridis]|uniref:Uncharacterized protein n=1 Tax=Micromonospora parathelypteridis TaxID=1839617 RepID=A0A840VSB7_9ACTN|nr:hypothetical protein [Micromonospora parathelypteridis]MBB5476884.1 hypothetical protein [Micromonospora parathelypteridis]GGO17499.1 hypothetical protein GCM10011576_31460 [Micromonospora parathelypteridis]